MNDVKGFPTDRSEKRRVLMDAVESVRATLEAGAAESEETATLAPASVDALYDSGLFRLKMPHVLGGAEADLVTQLDVLEAVSRIDPASGWCLMIGAASLGSLASVPARRGHRGDFRRRKTAQGCGSSSRPTGRRRRWTAATCLTGRWPFGSGDETRRVGLGRRAGGRRGQRRNIGRCSCGWRCPKA